MAQVSRMPEYPFAVIAHPISNNSDLVLREKAETAVQQCVAILVGRYCFCLLQTQNHPKTAQNGEWRVFSLSRTREREPYRNGALSPVLRLRRCAATLRMNGEKSGKIT